MTAAYIVDAVRTAGGRRGGRLAGVHPVDLLARSLDALVDRTGIDPKAIDDVIAGCVSQAGEQASNGSFIAVRQRLASGMVRDHAYVGASLISATPGPRTA